MPITHKIKHEVGIMDRLDFLIITLSQRICHRMSIIGNEEICSFPNRGKCSAFKWYGAIIYTLRLGTSSNEGSVD
jgi:hypothetical protein